VPGTRTILAAILGFTVVLGAWSGVAIYRTANRRVVLTDALSLRVPRIPGARVLSSWKPVGDADLAHMELCFDDEDPRSACVRFAAALNGTPWHAHEIRPTPPDSRRATVTAEDSAYRLRALAEPGSRSNCDGSRRQTLLSIEAAPVRHEAPARPSS
jgi:hypothetical protein